jgi:nitrite reductase/ring-hydroxylating ferredoxin subunit
VRRQAAERTAPTAPKAGIAGAVAAAATGLADWQHSNRRARRIGVDHADRSPVPREFLAVARLDELEEDRPRKVVLHDAEAARDVPVVLVRHRGRVHAMGARCAHLGGPLDRGWVLEGQLVCPWHGSRFALEDARPTAGPSVCAQPRYEVRLQDGLVEIRREQEPGDPHALPGGEAPAPRPRRAGGRRADEVLTAHHDLFRELLARIAAADREDPERRDLLRVLAAELDMHEQIEDHPFYPAVAKVSPDVPIAHSGHCQRTDLLARTLKLNTASAAFETHLRALRAAVEQHAGSEARSMSQHAQRLGEARLRKLGRELEAMLEALRGSQSRRLYRELKIGLLEGAEAGPRRA